MEDGGLAKKLGIKGNHRVMVMNAPDGFVQEWKLPEETKITEHAEGVHDIVLVFAPDKATLAQFASAALAVTAPGGRLWIAFPKGISNIQTDLTRDSGWDVIITTTGRKFMSLISVNEIWSAARLNPAELTINLEHEFHA